VTGPTDDPLKGHGAAFGTFDVSTFIRAKKDLFKEVGALKASKFKNGHDLLPRLLCFFCKCFEIISKIEKWFEVKDLLKSNRRISNKELRISKEKK